MRDWVGQMCPALQSGQPLEDAGQPGQPQASSSGAASSSTQAAVVDDGVAPAKPATDKEVILLEGVHCEYEKRTGRYERLRAQCPKCNARVQRSFSASLARASGLGDLEPFAFVGDWLSRCTDSADTGSHKSWRPSAPDVKAYATRCQWV